MFASSRTIQGRHFRLNIKTHFFRKGDSSRKARSVRKKCLSINWLAKRLNELALPGLKFTPVLFTPSAEAYQGQLCSGVRLWVSDPKVVRPVDLFVHISCLLRELWPKDFLPRWDEVARVTGSQDFEHLYIENKPAADILAVFHKSADDFIKSRQPYLLY